MKKAYIAVLAILIVSLFAGLTVSQSGGTFVIRKSIIAGGGGSATGGTFIVNGTIGQPFGGTTSTGGTFSETGGYWSAGTSASGSPTPTPSGSLSGTITYGNAASPPKFISNVLISGAGSPNVSTTTALPGATAGQYTLTGFGAGSYTVTPTKPTGGVNGISSFDAGKIAAQVAGPAFMNATQLIAADTSGNNAVSSFDAGLIAKFVVNSPPFGQAGTWKFFTPGPTFPIGASPTSRTYPSVASNITGDDYIGVLVGEVSGNWNPSAAPIRPAGGGAAQGDGDGVRKSVAFPLGEGRSPGANGPERSIGVTMPHLVTPAGNEVIVPVSVQGVSNKGIISYEFNLRYDSTVIQPQSTPIELAGTVSSRLSFAVNADEPGLMRVAVYGAMPLDDNGVLLNLRFTAVGTSGSVSPLTWERIMFNEGGPLTLVTDGHVELSAKEF